MTGQAASHYSSAGREAESRSGWAVGFILFAGVMMIMAGAFQAMAGLVALFQNEFYVTTATTSSSSTPPAGAGSICSSECWSRAPASR